MWLYGWANSIKSTLWFNVGHINYISITHLAQTGHRTLTNSYIVTCTYNFGIALPHLPISLLTLTPVFFLSACLGLICDHSSVKDKYFDDLSSEWSDDIMMYYALASDFRITYADGCACWAVKNLLTWNKNIVPYFQRSRVVASPIKLSHSCGCSEPLKIRPATYNSGVLNHGELGKQDF